MIVGLIGRLFRAVGRLHVADGGDDLEHVGNELVRLEGRRSQRPVTSR
ncbi:MAG: hypothetical protein WB788_02525 [Thermoplasmata archaeon]|nr:hypothetical protein [Thermoplasmata archaeon]